MDEQQLQQQIVQLVLAAMQGDQLATQLIQQIMQAAQQGDQQAMQIAQMIQQVAQAMQQQDVQAAKFGAKLNYIKQLRGQCPEGYEMQSYKVGGKVCKKCMKKQDGGNMSQAPQKMSIKDEFMKCGGKTKKPKKEVGGSIPEAKCGKKMKKKAEGGEVEMDKCGKKLKKSACGSSLMQKKANGGNFISFKAEGGILKTTKPTLKKLKFTQTQKSDSNGTLYTRTFPGFPPVSYYEPLEGEGVFFDHTGLAPINVQDSLWTVYNLGPQEAQRIYGKPKITPKK